MQPEPNAESAGVHPIGELSMKEFMRCVAEAIAENGVKGLLDMVPGGNFTYAVGSSAWKKYCERRQQSLLREDIEALAQAQFGEVQSFAAELRAEVELRLLDNSKQPPPSSEDLITLELYLTAIPEAIRQSLKRAEDPSGRTAPRDFAVRNVDDLVTLLPARPFKYRENSAVPGKPGWILERPLGLGGFGEVWLAKHSRFPSLFGAIKFCFGQSGRDLIHEADLINRVMQAGSHPNIVALKDAHLEGDAPWLMFEFVGGGNLTDWIHSLASLPNEKRLLEVISAIQQLTEAVGFFHTLPRPIVHRDLKPSNILVDQATKLLRITDFGIGSVTAQETNRIENRGQSTRGGRLLSYLHGSHTPIYSSPQQRRGNAPDPRDDVHALGVIAFQMLTGKLDSGPGPRAGQTLRKAGVSEELTELLLNCVSEEVEDRPLTA
jgi:eukaryotic-like serine/threonine-protein kinase